MNLVRRNNWLPSMLEDMFNGNWMDTNHPIRNFENKTPAVNVKESENNFTLELGAPGMKKDNFQLELDDNLLSISSEKKAEKETENKDEKFTIREYSYSSFKHSYILTESVDFSKISEDYKDGVLKIDLPKREEAKTQHKRLIEIQ